jgi:hypothetical protein
MDVPFADRIEVIVTHPRTGRTVISMSLYRLLFGITEPGYFSLADLTHPTALQKGIPYRCPDGRPPVDHKMAEPQTSAGKSDPCGCAEGRGDRTFDSTQSPESNAGRSIPGRNSVRDIETGIPDFALEYADEDGFLSMQAATPTLVAYLAADGARPLPVRVTERVAGRSTWYEVETFHRNAARWHLRKGFAKKELALEAAKAMGR